MSTAQTDRPTATDRPAAQPTSRRPPVSADRPTGTYQTGRLATAYPLPKGWRVDPAGYLPQPSADGGAAAARLQEADATPTQTFPVHPLGRQPQAFPAVEPEAEHEVAARAALWPEVAEGAEGADAAFTARTGARWRARVYHTPARRGEAPAAGRTERPALQRARTERRERVRRHLRAALAAIALAAALLSVLQAYAASGITQARQAALAARTEGAAPAAAPAAATSSTMSGQTTSPSDWVTQDTGAPYVRTNPHASPLTDLPRCTTAPTTPMPCLAHVSANFDRVVVLEEDGSLTGLVPSHTR